MNRDELIDFETDIAAEFNAGRIPYPVHLSDGNEDQLIEVFWDIRRRDWICGSWRSHYHCLLKGVPGETLKAAIMDGKSIALNFPEHRIVCSALAGGSIPIALGIALGIKRNGVAERVHCFVGDMMAESGIFSEARKYARFNDLPVRWIIEDNGVSVCTDTADAWGGSTNHLAPSGRPVDLVHYRYHSKYPHAGAGSRVQF